MAEYAGYKFYTETFHGSTIPEAAFSNASVRASGYVKYFTSGRVLDTFEMDYPEYAEDIKLAVCAIAEVFFQEEKRLAKHDGREIASENNDGYSVTFADSSSGGGISLAGKQARQKAHLYLAHTGLLYRGVYS